MPKTKAEVGQICIFIDDEDLFDPYTGEVTEITINEKGIWYDFQDDRGCRTNYIGEDCVFINVEEFAKSAQNELKNIIEIAQCELKIDVFFGPIRS